MAYISSFRDQNWLIPQSIRDMIPNDHISFFVEEFVDSLDFSGFDEISEGPGHPSYHPRIIMKIIIQGMLCKERSSRRLASACRENFVFMYLAEKVQPEFGTICRFRKNNEKFMKEAFKETVKLASSYELVDLNLICIDGSKMKANASKKKMVRKEDLDKLDSIVDRMVEEDIAQDELDLKIFGDKEENKTNIDMKNLKEIVKEYRKNKNKEKIKENLKKVRGEFEKNPDLKKVSLSDPDSRIMIGSENSYSLSYNSQLSVDSKNQIIVANEVTKDCVDANQLEPQVNNIRENIDLKEDTKFALDCGYSSGENCKFLEDKNIEGYIPNKMQAALDREQKSKVDDYGYDWNKNEIIVKGVRYFFYNTYYDKKRESKFHMYRSKDNKTKCVPEFFRERLRMKKKMETKESREIYDQRKITVEPVFGNLKENLGFRGFKSRGLDGAKIELNIVSIIHNLKKIWKVKGKISLNNKNIIFELIINNNQMYCETAW